jgi:predicted AAA+ superfamily ATPase
VERSLEHLLLQDHFRQRRMAFVVGPRQVGKTTLGQALLKTRHSPDLYRNWDDPAWRAAFAREPFAFVDQYRPIVKGERPLVVLDEIHRYPRWKRFLKGLWDTRKDRVDVLVTGSGRLDVYQRGGDSLLGRYHQYRMHPLSVRELLDPTSPSQDYHLDDTLERLTGVAGRPERVGRGAFESLVRYGGFPEPFLDQSERRLRLWHRERKDLLVREDLRDLSRIQLISHVEQLVELLDERCAGPLSFNSLREDLQVATDSVRLWVSYLERLYYIYLLRPFAGRLARTLRRVPKVFLWDWSAVSQPGARLENLIASHLLKWCQFTQDWGHPRLDLYFVRDKEGREVDFLINREGKPWLLVEVKSSKTSPGAAIHYFASRLGVRHKFLVVGEPIEAGTAGDVRVLDASAFLAALPV